MYCRTTQLVSAPPRTLRGSDPELAWELPPSDWTLSTESVHVWAALLDQPEPIASELTSLLSEDELLRSSRFRFDQERNRYAIGRGMLRSILGVYLDLDPASLCFEYGPHGKPVLAEPWTGLAFNLSHSGKLALFAVSRLNAVGIDIERVCWLAEADTIAWRFFTNEEKLRLRRTPPESRLQVFFEIWTCKEAVLKCAGQGIGGIERPGMMAAGNFSQILSPASGYVGHVAADSTPALVQTWRWPLASSPA